MWILYLSLVDCIPPLHMLTNWGFEPVRQVWPWISVIPKVPKAIMKPPGYLPAVTRHQTHTRCTAGCLVEVICINFMQTNASLSGALQGKMVQLLLQISPWSSSWAQLLRKTHKNDTDGSYTIPVEVPREQVFFWNRGLQKREIRVLVVHKDSPPPF